MISQRVKPKFLWFRISIAIGVLLGLLSLGQTLATYHYVSRNLVRQEAGREAERRIQALARAARAAGTEESNKLTPTLNELVRESPEQLAWIRIIGPDGKVVAASEDAGAAPEYKAGEIARLMENRDRVPAEVETKDGTVVVILNPMRFGPPPATRRRAEQAPQPARGETAPAPSVTPTAPTDTAAPASVTPPPLPAIPVLPALPLPLPGIDSGGRGERGGGGDRNGRGGGRGRRNQDVAEIGIYLSGVSTTFGSLQQNLIVGCAAALALLGSMIIIGLRFRGYMLSKHIEEELSVARRVQLDLFPAENSIATNLEFAARCGTCVSGGRRLVRCVRHG